MLWQSDGAVICSAIFFFLRWIVDSTKGNHLILTCTNNTGMKCVNIIIASFPKLTLCQPPLFFLLFLRSHFLLLSPLTTVHYSQRPPHCSLKAPGMLPSHKICTCYSLCLEFSSTYVHGLFCHLNRSPLKWLSQEKPLLTTLNSNSTFCSSLAFHTAFVSLHSSLNCLTIECTYLFISPNRMQAQQCFLTMSSLPSWMFQAASA